jgi:branched-chain amino acid transport system ATP-binding protein
MAETAAPILVIRDLSKRFGALKASDGVSMDVYPGEIHALIGPNGAGKTTLISQLSGYLTPDSGEITFNDVDLLKVPAHRRAHLGLARSFQITSLFQEFSVLDNVCMALQALEGHSYHFLRPASADAAQRERGRKLLERTRLDAEAERPAYSLAYGQQRQLEIAMALAAQPQLLLLDEPMAGIGPSESRFVIELLRGLKRRHAMLLVEHDMDAVFALADRVSVIVYGQVIATGSPAEIRASHEVQTAYLGTHHIHGETMAGDA